MQVACEVSVQNRLAVAATLFAALTVLVPRSASAQGPDLTVAAAAGGADGAPGLF